MYGCFSSGVSNFHLSDNVFESSAMLNLVIVPFSFCRSSSQNCRNYARERKVHASCLYAFDAPESRRSVLALARRLAG
jgi:hypothetical protein